MKSTVRTCGLALRYQLESFIFIGGSGSQPGFVDKNSIVAASYPSGR
jgi:hypothetical protein